MKKTCICLLLAFVWFAAGCSEDKDECSNRDLARCSDDGHGFMACHDGKWTEVSCGANSSCVYLDGAVLCVEGVAVSRCHQGETTCRDNGVMQTCGADGVWQYKTCGNGESCQGGKCVETQGPVTPVEPEAGKKLSGTVVRTCSSDGNSIRYHDIDGKITSKTCLEEVGFASKCEQYSSGHVGCAMPSECTELFSETGTCQGTRHFWCNDMYLPSRPSIEDCAVRGEVCATVGGVSKCAAKCETADASAFSCANDGQVTRCVDAGGINVVEKGVSLCESETVSAACMSGKVAKVTCEDGEKCYASHGVCLESCTAAEVNGLKCSKTGELLRCEGISEGYAWVKTYGRRHCFEENLYTCVQNDGETEYTLKETNCAAYKMDDGTIIEAKCVTDYQYVPDVDMCIPKEGEPCGDLTEEGVCNGAKFSYCDSMMDEAYSADCSANANNTACSVYFGIADCRKPCTKKGAASCAYSENYQATMVTVCVPDDVSETLTEVENDRLCLDDVLYSCSADGVVEMTNCAANGGRCDKTECVYPACIISEPVCFADDAMVSCQKDASGVERGSVFQTMTCDAGGECYVCSSGKLVSK